MASHASQCQNQPHDSLM